MELNRSEEGGTLFLPEHCVIDAASELAEALGNAAKDKTFLAVDVSAVKRIDLSGLQLLLAYLRTTNKGKRQLKLTGSFGDSVQGAVNLSGFGPLLGPYRTREESGDVR